MSGWNKHCLKSSKHTSYEVILVLLFLEAYYFTIYVRCNQVQKLIATAGQCDQLIIFYIVCPTGWSVFE